MLDAISKIVFAAVVVGVDVVVIAAELMVSGIVNFLHIDVDVAVGSLTAATAEMLTAVEVIVEVGNRVVDCFESICFVSIADCFIVISVSYVCGLMESFITAVSVALLRVGVVEAGCASFPVKVTVSAAFFAGLDVSFCCCCWWWWW
jgi:hypothetical protein